MDEKKLVIDGKEPVPQVDFDFSANTFSFSGTCYPENSIEFFKPIVSKLDAHLKTLSGSEVLFELNLTYFNSGASRAFTQFFDMLEQAAREGNDVTIKWRCEADDENMIELAEDFEEDFEAASFQVVIEDPE